MQGVFHLFAVSRRLDDNLVFTDYWLNASNCAEAYSHVQDQISNADEVYCSRLPATEAIIAGPIVSETSADHHAAWVRTQDTHRRMK